MKFKLLELKSFSTSFKGLRSGKILVKIDFEFFSFNEISFFSLFIASIIIALGGSMILHLNFDLIDQSSNSFKVAILVLENGWTVVVVKSFEVPSM